MSSLISIRSLCSGYGKHQILYDVDFDTTNNITAIIGSNGSGKSTMLKSICGLCDVYQGNITFNGKEDILKLSTHKIMKMGISYMFQTNNVFSELSIKENLSIASMPDKPDWDYLFDFFPTLKDKLSHKAKTLSGGQRQFLAMAMSISKNPQIMLLDEPTANLSPQASKFVLEKITQIQKRLNNCIIIVEQNVKSVLKISHRCCLFANGKKIFDGLPQDLLDDPNFNDKFLGVSK